MRIRYFIYVLTVMQVLVWRTTLAAPEYQYNMDEISSLQKEYRSQLNKKKPKINKARKTVAKRKKNNSIISKQELMLIQQATQRKPRPKPVRKTQRATPRAVPRHIPRQNPRVQVLRPKPKVQTRQVSAPPSKNSFFAAASTGDVRAIGQLLSQGANVNVVNNERETALHMAAAKGHYSAVIYLINHGANLHARTINNWLPIHHASRFGHANIANYLKQRGSSPYAKTSDGLSAIDMARATKDRRILGIFGVR